MIKMKNKVDCEKISFKIIIDQWNLIGETLLEVINTSLSMGEFTATWKDSMLTPVLKTNKCEEF